MGECVKILLVEDSSFDSSLIKGLLEEENYSVDVVSNGLEALNYLKMKPSGLPSLVLTDIFMPKMNGFELCAQLAGYHNEIPCIILTAHNDEENLAKAFRAGALDYLIKPCTKSELSIRIKNVLKIRGSLFNMEVKLAKRLEELEMAYSKLKIANKRFKDISFASHGWLWEVDKNGMYTYCSDNVANILGYHADEIIGKTPFDFMPDYEADKIRHKFKAISENRSEINDLENWNICKDGQEICVLSNGVPIIRECNELVGYRGYDRDITEKKIIEKKQNELISIIENCQDFVAVASLEGKILYVNSGGLDIVGVEESKDVLKTKIFDYFQDNEFNRLTEIFNEVINKGFWKGESEFKQFNGINSIPVNLHIFLINDSETNMPVKFGIVGRDITKQKEMEKCVYHANLHLKELLYYDNLTSTVNRLPFIDLLEKNITRAERDNQKLALLFLDFENFKNVNDIYGHETGDTALKIAADIIRCNIRRGDILGRLGGDEFVICLNNINSLDSAIQVAEKINYAFSKKIKINNLMLDLGVSIGIAVYPDNGNKAFELLKNSDIAMYKAKKQSKNSFHIYNTNLKNELCFNQALNNALENDEFKINYQIILNNSLQPCFIEALLRWDNLEFGSVDPMVFIPVLEQNGNINKIGEWVFREACSDLKKLNSNHKFKNIGLSVNISQYQMEDKSFINIIKNTIHETNVNPGNLLVEITEKTHIRNVAKVNNVISKLRDNGIRLIALDDFGSGYSSFSNIVNLPVDLVKIDNSFVHRLDHGKYCRVVANLIKLMKNYDLKVMAEGIETKEQFERLNNMGCDYFQGYYFGRPKKNIFDCLDASYDNFSFIPKKTEWFTKK